VVDDCPFAQYRLLLLLLRVLRPRWLYRVEVDVMAVVQYRIEDLSYKQIDNLHHKSETEIDDVQACFLDLRHIYIAKIAGHLCRLRYLVIDGKHYLRSYGYESSK
jgi:hypothetical protein